jgi:hypothetical protein
MLSLFSFTNQNPNLDKRGYKWFHYCSPLIFPLPESRTISFGALRVTASN